MQWDHLNPPIFLIIMISEQPGQYRVGQVHHGGGVGETWQQEEAGAEAGH